MSELAVLGESVVLDEPVWRAMAQAHRARVGRWTGPHRERRRRGEPHPVMDFLFTYYSLRPQQLERWHPGPGVALRGAAELLDTSGTATPCGSTRRRCRTASGRRRPSSGRCSWPPPPARRG